MTVRITGLTRIKNAFSEAGKRENGLIKGLKNDGYMATHKRIFDNGSVGFIVKVTENKNMILTLLPNGLVKFKKSFKNFIFSLPNKTSKTSVTVLQDFDGNVIKNTTKTRVYVDKKYYKALSSKSVKSDYLNGDAFTFIKNGDDITAQKQLANGDKYIFKKENGLMEVLKDIGGVNYAFTNKH